MENKKQIFLIIFAVVAGIAATLLTSNYVIRTIEQKTQELSDQYDQKQKQMAAELQQQSQQQVAALREEIGRISQQQQETLQKANAAMQAGQQGAAMGKQRARRATTLLTMKTPAGKRAVTVMIDSLAAVGGLLNPGDFVDVMAHLNVPEEASSDKKKTLTAMVFQDLQVLAINTNLEDAGAYDEQQAAGSLKVTFAVDPQEAGLLAFADKNGKLELALRATNENDKQMVKASTWKTLADYVLQNQGSAIDVPEEGMPKTGTKEGKPYIQIFRGGKEL
ncbi:MAG: Flp pilus assembly protein CpaB [Candidatus Omnitrophica bacterium]|nr:Flp pilus assembly protein CpaB [Candidatus Omnitrophota bacterium]